MARKKEEMPVADPVKPGPFDVATVAALVALMAENDLNEIDLSDGGQRLRLRRGVMRVPAALPAQPAPAPTPVAAPAASVNNAPAANSKKPLEIKSETVGTFYASANPESPPFVRVGSRVAPDTVVCIIDVMKTMNEMTAGVSGVITQVLVENQTPVEFGQVLFLVDPG